MTKLYSWKTDIIRMWGGTGTAYHAKIRQWTDEFLPGNGAINDLKYQIEDELKEQLNK